MSKVTVAEYLFTRLKQCGLKTMFGVPGDYNLQLLDHVEPQGLQWVGNCNELNAGYAADGYARVVGIGSLITTFGVGELSAINAIAGAYAEKAPVVHIVGTPPRKTRTNKLFVHHTLGDGDYLHFAEMAKHVTVAQARLWDLESAPGSIDTAITKCLEHSRPVYISLPDDMVNELVDSTMLSGELTPQPTQGEVPKLLLEKIHESRKPVILVDGECQSVKKEINQLVEKTGLPTFVSHFGKSIVEESLPNFYGVWGPDTESYWKDSDLILCFGPHWSGTNTFLFTAIPDPTITLRLNADGVGFQEKHYDCSFPNILKTLLEADIGNFSATSIPKKHTQNIHEQNGPLRQAYFYKNLSRSGLFQPGDNILAETGTASTGSRDFELPKDTLLFNAVTWLSIGYMLPAALGVALARPKRTILLIGDGSFQMTAQELGTIIKEKLNFLLILLNNDGYTIERCIHGKDEKYNDVTPWNYLNAPMLFGRSSNDYSIRTASARTWEELEGVLNVEKRQQSPAFSMIEVHMTREDAPAQLLALLEKQYPNGLPNGISNGTVKV